MCIFSARTSTARRDCRKWSALGSSGVRKPCALICRRRHRFGNANFLITFCGRMSRMQRSGVMFGIIPCVRGWFGRQRIGHIGDLLIIDDVIRLARRREVLWVRARGAQLHSGSLTSRMLSACGVRCLCMVKLDGQLMWDVLNCAFLRNRVSG